MSTQLKARSEMDSRFQWNLSDIFKDAQAFEAAIVQAKSGIDQIKKLQGTVARDPKKPIVEYYKLMEQIEKLYAYAMMQHDSDGSNADYMSDLGRMQSLATEAETAVSWLTPELLELPEEKLKSLRNDPDFQDYQTFIDEVLRDRPHILPADQEQLLAMASESLQTPSSAFRALSDVELPMPEITDESGQKVQLSHGRYQSFLRSKDRNVRKAAFEGLHGAYRDFGRTFAALYSGSVKKHVFNARVRHFSSAIESSLYPDQVPLSVYDNLITAVDEALPALDRYLDIRKKLLGLDELHMYDLYVPMISGVQFPVTYEDAQKLVLEALSPLGQEYTDVLRRAFAERWIDVYENKAKRSGAYSNGVYGVHPYVLMNFENNLDSASTLAHELGHTMHSWYSDKCQPFPKAGYSLFVAEVASTVNEVLLNRYLQEKHSDNKELVKYLLNDLLESFRATVIRQTMFAAFEKRSHEMAEQGAPLTRESLSEAYYELNKHYYGRGVHVDDVIAYEWMRIPHFYRDFYVYKYATSFSASVSIADAILTGGSEAVDRHLRFLSLGGSVPPLEALKTDGVDMSTISPVREAMAIFAQTVDRLESML